MMAAALLLFALSPVVLLVLYALGIQAKRGGAWVVFTPLLWVGLVLDVLLNFSWFTLWFQDVPLHGEWTLSKRLPRLNTWDNWRGAESRALTRLLNRLDPSGVHVHEG